MYNFNMYVQFQFVCTSDKATVLAHHSGCLQRNIADLLQLFMAHRYCQIWLGMRVYTLSSSSWSLLSLSAHHFLLSLPGRAIPGCCVCTTAKYSCKGNIHRPSCKNYVWISHHHDRRKEITSTRNGRTSDGCCKPPCTLCTLY